MNIIDTERLRLRRWRTSDLSCLVPLLSDPEIMKFSDHGPLSLSDLKPWLQKTIARTPENSPLGMRAIELKSDGTVIGYVSLSNDLDRTKPGDAELGLRLAKEYWQFGYAHEAATAMVGLAFQDETVSRIVGIVDPSNVTSVRWLKRLGMTFQHDIEFECYDHPDHLYAMAATQ